MLVTVLMVPLVMVAMLLVVQFGLAYYARQVMSGATQDGATSGARQGSSPGSGASLADSLIEQSAGQLLTSHSSRGGGDVNTVTIDSHGQVVKVLPFFPTITITARASATLEVFQPQDVP